MSGSNLPAAAGPMEQGPIWSRRSTVASAREAVERFALAIEHPRALAMAPADREALERTLERVAAQLGRDEDLVLTIAIAGGSGAGKSTLINALAGAVIAEAAPQRPCTMQATVYHHRDTLSAGLPAELLAQVRQVPHERPELRFKVIVDTPDLDTFATQNRAATRALLKAAGLVVYVFTPEKYWDERVWSVIREEQRFSACLAVLNKSDTVPANALEKAADEIRRRFAELGQTQIPILRVAAIRHIPGRDGSLSTAATDPNRAIDEFPSLRSYIEYELREGEIARLRTQQRIGVVTHLEQQLGRVVPANLPERLERLTTLAEVQVDEASSQLAAVFTNQMSQIEAELRPEATLRRNQEFHGPFRAWLAAGSFLVDGLPRLGRRLRGFGAGGGGPDVSPLAVHQTEIEDQLRGRASRLRDAAFSENLPVERWRSISHETQPDRLVADLTREIHAQYAASTVRGAGRVRLVARCASTLGTLIPVGLAAYALWALIVRMNQGQLPGGLGMLGLVVTLTTLSYVILQAATSVALAGTGPPPVATVGPRATHSVLRRTLAGWIEAYRRDIEADLHTLSAAVDSLYAVAKAPIDLSIAAAPARQAEQAQRALEPPREPAETESPIEQPEHVEAVETPPSTPNDTAPDEPPTAAAVVPATHPETAPEPRPEPEPDPDDEPIPAPTARPAELFRNAVQRHADRAR